MIHIIFAKLNNGIGIFVRPLEVWPLGGPKIKIKEECVHRTRMPPLPKKYLDLFMLNYGMTLNFTILYFMKGHNSGKPK